MATPPPSSFLPTPNVRLPAPYRVAAIQFEPVLFEKDANLARLCALTEAAARDGAKLIVQPEMATTGYCWASREEIAPYVEPIPGPTTARFGEIAARYGCYVVVGMPEVSLATGVFYNSAALVGPDGLVGVYRKTHSYISEPKWAKDGDLGLPVFDTALGRIAIAICMDGALPETVRIPALRGADVVCFPTNWLSEKCPSATWMARALESGVYFIAANRYGCERGVQFSGGSCVIDPDGTIQSARDAGDGIVYGVVDPGRAQNKRVSPDQPEDKLADRRPDAYGNITLNTYLWNARDFHKLYGLRPLPEGRRSLIAACQFIPSGDVAANLARISACAERHREADVIILPELATTGAIARRADAERVAEVVPGPVCEELRRIAARSAAFLIAGIVEREDERLYNAAVLVGPHGVVGRYRKVHLTGGDRNWATAGDSLDTFDIPPGRIGILIGYDALFPEAARCLALEGADLIACPSLVSGPPVLSWGATALPFPSHVATGPTGDHFHLWRERSKENATYVAFANGAAPWMGWSGLFAPGFEDEPRPEGMVSGDGDGAVELELDTTNLDSRFVTNPCRAKEILGMRATIWYDALQAAPVASAEVPDLVAAGMSGASR